MAAVASWLQWMVWAEGLFPRHGSSCVGPVEIARISSQGCFIAGMALRLKTLVPAEHPASMLLQKGRKDGKQPMET